MKLSDDDILIIGGALEHNGLTEEEIDERFLSHYGVKGMKWGQRRAEARAAKGPYRAGNRNNARAQRNIDMYKRVATGTGSKADTAKLALLQLTPAEMIANGGVKGAAAHRLERAQRTQAKINAGKKNVTDILSRIGGVDIREINYDFD